MKTALSSETAEMVECFAIEGQGISAIFVMRGHWAYMADGYLIQHTSSSFLLHARLAALGEDGLQVAFKQGAGVLEILFGVGFGGGDAFKRFDRGCRRSAAVRRGAGT